MEDFIQWKDKDGKVTTAFVTRSVGVVGAQPYVKQLDDKTFEARCAISLMGSYNMKEDELAKIQYNPFHPDFLDNFAQGLGITKEEALKAMDDDCRSISDSLWYE